MQLRYNREVVPSETLHRKWGGVEVFDPLLVAEKDACKKGLKPPTPWEGEVQQDKGGQEEEEEEEVE